ncbi:Ig-like domain-containing protein [Gelidibacter mesophilus]|uniref:Ig-like domain-containing protein n=1 Tax=Gelidibacter mesophilus TaxID=169050 RepID=UPI0004225ACA|nr:Ig-like domain-containing protein [Gelidibacter mesophilus]
MKFPNYLTGYIRNKTTLCLFFMFIFLSEYSNSQQLAFPSAYGSGAYVTGGRGKDVYHVTNLNDSGYGSLRDALSQSNRTIVFDVSGVIKLKSRLVVEDKSNITIAGQTAPEGGITIDGEVFRFQRVTNLIVRYIRFKGGIRSTNYEGGATNSFQSKEGSKNQIYDHCTFSFGFFQGGSWYDAGGLYSSENLTVQRCFFPENDRGALVGALTGTTSTTKGASFLFNCFYHVSHRTPNINGDLARFDVINNVVWYVRHRLMQPGGSQRLNHIGNYYHYNNTKISKDRLQMFANSDSNLPEIYTNGNMYVAPQGIEGPGVESVTELNSDNRLSFKGFYNGGLQVPMNHFVSKMHPLNGEPFKILSAEEAFINVINNVGCNARLNSDGSVSDNTDILDKRYIHNMKNNVMLPPKLSSDMQNWIVPPIPSVVRGAEFYGTNSHIPEIWFSINVPKGQDHNDIAPSGYTWLEEYLNQVDRPNNVIDVRDVAIIPYEVNVQLAKTHQLNPIFTPANATIKDGKWNSDNVHIATVDTNGVVTAISTGTATITFMSADGGFKATSLITVFPPALQASAGIDQRMCNGESITLTATGGASYKWNTGETAASITVNPKATTTYTVTAYDSTGTNSDSDDVKVTVNPLPKVNAGNDITIKLGESTTLTATGATTYSWNTKASGESITVSPKATTTYTVTGISNGCEATDSVKVIVIDTVELIANAGTDQKICAGTSATLTATGGTTYNWNTGETTASITVNPNETTTYKVTAFDSTGNKSDSDDVKVTVNPLPKVDAGRDITITLGESTTLTAIGATTYKWDTGDTTASVTVNPKSTRTYSVIGTSNGCEATDKVKVTVLNPIKVVADAGADQNICAGTTATLTATGGTTYKWNTGETSASITVNPKTTTTYSVTAYDNSGKNSDKDEVVITLNPLPKVDAGKDITIALGESATLTATGATTYRWSTKASGASITINPKETTTYTVVGKTNDCESRDTIIVTVVQPETAVVADAGANKVICPGSIATLTATGGDRYLWSTGEKTASIDVSPTSTTKYSVTAYIADASNRDEVTVFVGPSPNVSITNGSEATILEGEFITLSATGANTYKWSNGATQPNIAVRPNVSETYDVVGYINDCSSQKSITVNVFEKVVANAGEDVAICLTENTVLTADGPANSEYLWSTGETSKSITVEPSEDTEYSVMVYHALDSDTDSVMVMVNNCNAHQIVEDTQELEFLIHPNPTNGELHINISGLTSFSSINLYDLSGKSLYNEIINEGDQQKYIKTLNLSNYASGIYLLQLVDNQKVITKKVVLR